MSRDAQQLIRVVTMVLRLGRGKLGVGGMIGLVLAAVLYVAVIQPAAKSRFGIDLPTIAGTQDDRAQAPPERRAETTERERPATEQASRVEQADPGELSDLLEEIGRERYRSPEGLVYTRGSAHGHRLKHLMAHAADVPDRDIHGVFDSTDPRTLVLLVDEVYGLAKGGQGTAKSQDGRDVYVVDLDRRIGYIGGRAGKRRGNPAAEHVRLVVQEDRFITAFPVKE